MNQLRSPHLLTLIACLGLALAPAACASDPADTGTDDTTGDGDGDTDPETGSADQGDGDPGDGDGDGDPGDGDPGDGDGDPGDGDPGDGDPGDGDGDPTGDVPNGGTCTTDAECMSGNCYLVPFLGGQCGECNEDADCMDGGCTPPNPFEMNGSTCNMGEAGGGCETDEVCQMGLTCGTVLDLLGLIQINTCGECSTDADCDEFCAPIVDVQAFNGQNTCVTAASLPQDSFCLLDGNGNDVCESGICSVVDIMQIAEVGACGECNTDQDCGGNLTCQLGGFDIGNGTLTGSVCM